MSFERVNQRSRAFAPNLGLGPPKGVSIGRFEWGRRVCGGLSSALGVARCGRSAGCVLCVLWAMSAAVLGGGVPCGGKDIIIRWGLSPPGVKCLVDARHVPPVDRVLEPHRQPAGWGVGLYTILPLPIMYGVWHTKEGSGKGSCIAR